jgi:hypothetical protein
MDPELCHDGAKAADNFSRSCIREVRVIPRIPPPQNTSEMRVPEE